MISVYKALLMSMLNDKSAFKFQIARLDTDEYDSIGLNDKSLPKFEKRFYTL